MPSRIETSLPGAPLLVTARSALPSPLKSPTAISSGCALTAWAGGVAGAKPPVPSPDRMETVPLGVLFATARSRLPSPLKSRAATPRGLVPTPKFVGPLKLGAAGTVEVAASSLVAT